MNKTACVVRNQTLYNICCILNKGGKIPMCKMGKKLNLFSISVEHQLVHYKQINGGKKPIDKRTKQLPFFQA